MPRRQPYRLRSRSDREVIVEVEPGREYVDGETGERFEIVGKPLPLAPSPSNLPYAVENLRLCGCSLEQLVQRDLNDCPHCGRRMPALAARRDEHPVDTGGADASGERLGDRPSEPAAPEPAEPRTVAVPAAPAAAPASER